MRRTAVLLARQVPADAAPPGVSASAYARALVEDTYEALTDLAEVDVAVAVPPTLPWRDEVLELLWPATPVLELMDAAGQSLVLEVLERLGTGALDPVPDRAVVVAGDVPDLPGLVLAKCLSALEDLPVAAVPALRGGLVALGCQLPAPAWLLACGVDLDTPDARDRLRQAAPPRSFLTTRPWRRLRSPADVASLDPGLEGWEATRALLSAG